MKIRKAKNQDLKEIARIFKTESNKKPYVQGWTDEGAMKKVQNIFKNAEIFVYFYEGEIAGFVSVIREKEKSEYYIDEMWFDKKYQGRGFGTELIGFIENMCKRKGVKTLSVLANQEARARDFYNKMKFKEKLYLVVLKKELR